MRTGENDKLDAKHNAGVGPGNSANEANLAAFFSLLLVSFATFSFLLSSLLSFFPSLSYDVKIECRYPVRSPENLSRFPRNRCEFLYFRTTLHRFETFATGISIEDVDRALIGVEDVVGLLCKGFDLAKRARGDALRALVTSRAESSRGP